MLIVLTGIPGSGKTTLGNKIASKYGFVFVKKDDIQNALVGDIDRSDLDSDSIYKALYNIVKTNIVNGNKVIVEGTFHKTIKNPGWDKKYKELAYQYNIKYLPLRCIASEETIKQRLIDRGLERDKNKLENFSSWRVFLKKEPIYPEKYTGKFFNTELDSFMVIDRLLKS